MKRSSFLRALRTLSPQWGTTLACIQRLGKMLALLLYRVILQPIVVVRLHVRFCVSMGAQGHRCNAPTSFGTCVTPALCVLSLPV